LFDAAEIYQRNFATTLSVPLEGKASFGCAIFLFLNDKFGIYTRTSPFSFSGEEELFFLNCAVFFRQNKAEVDAILFLNKRWQLLPPFFV
jgi:hypothetical protein